MIDWGAAQRPTEAGYRAAGVLLVAAFLASQTVTCGLVCTLRQAMPLGHEHGAHHEMMIAPCHGLWIGQPTPRTASVGLSWVAPKAPPIALGGPSPRRETVRGVIPRSPSPERDPPPPRA